MDFENKLREEVRFVEEKIAEYLPKEEGFQKTVIEAMNYSFSAGGKRLRPLIMYKTFSALSGDSQMIYPFMAALEMIHTYSLIHDDLPEMDNDELRRGKPTTHIKYGQAMAVLAGDGLLNYAFETMARSMNSMSKEGNYDEIMNAVKALNVVAAKAGIYGMVGGQTVDVEAEKKGLTLSQEQLLFTYENKTAALLQTAFMAGGILAGADDKTVDALEKAGYLLGVAFQLQDDILDITSSTEVLGKPVGSDEKNGKVTYVSYLGMENAVEEQKRLSEECVSVLQSINAAKEEDKQFIIELVKSLVTRTM